MSDPKDRVASAIARAQADLDDALADLEKMPAFDPSAVAFAAHALNNFLTVTDGTVELLMLRLAASDDDQVRSWLKAVQHATQLMTRTVGQMMTAAATTDTKLRFESVDLSLLMQRACQYYDRLASRKNITVTSSPAGPVPPVWTDRVAVAAILDNLLSNAVKYSEPGKSVVVQLRHEQDFVVCGVRDDGPGLSRDDQARLFQKGIRLTPKPTGDEASTGYGLAVAKELIEKLDGEIWCESILGHGSSFLFRLPISRDPKPRP
jgi:two-component system, sensor histidine kinase and response regulator